MTYYADLTPFTYDDFVEAEGELRNVGWLSSLRPFRQGRPSRDFRRRLFDLCSEPQVHHLGYHNCRIDRCRLVPRRRGVTTKLKGRSLTLGSGIVVLEGRDGVSYAFPDLLYHYVKTHWYRPPDEFVEAVMHPTEGRSSAEPSPIIIARS